MSRYKRYSYQLKLLTKNYKTMSQLVYARLAVDDNPILLNANFSIELDQNIAEHHQLKVQCSTDAIENSINGFAENSKNLIGSKVFLKLSKQLSEKGDLVANDLEFMGIINKVNVHKFDNADGTVTIHAQSPTILLNQMPHNESFENQTLKQIVEGIMKKYSTEYIDAHVNPIFTEAIPYTVQYAESDFDFIKRLAQRYGEWFYYDGKSLRFGKKQGKNVELFYGKNITEFNFVMNTLPQKTSYMAYDVRQGTTQESSLSEFKKTSSNPFVSHLVSKSEKMFDKNSTRLYNYSLLENGKYEIDKMAALKAETLNNLVEFNVTSEEPSIQLGDFVKLQGESNGLSQKEYYGKYSVTKIIHKVDSSGEYNNEFNSIPFEIQVAPYFSENAVPISEDQVATVTDVNDPNGLSRIRVQFPWQKSTNQKTPWIKTTTPYAGSGKGMHMIPEVGEEVIVGFESGCAEKPFVIGTYYSGAAFSGYDSSNNDQKVIHTRSGTKIIFNDAAGSIFVEDPSGNHWLLDGNGNIKVSAVKNISLQAGQDFEIQVGGNMTMNVAKAHQESVGSTKSSTVGGDAKVQVKGKLTEVIDGDVVSEVKSGKTLVNSDGGIQTFSQSSIQQHAQSKVMNLSGEKSLSL